MTGNPDPGESTSRTHQSGKRMKTPAAAVGASALLGIVVLGTVPGAGVQAAAPPAGGAGNTTIASTPPSTLPTPVATPTLTATPYGGEGP